MIPAPRRPLLALALVGCGSVGSTAPPPAPAAPEAAPAKTRRLVYRDVSIGMTRAKSFRSTWKLSLDAKGSSLNVATDEGTGGASVATMGTVKWASQEDAWYRGPRLDATEDEVKLARQGGTGGIAFRCHAGAVKVLDAVAVLVHGNACGGYPKPYWKPATKKSVPILHCEAQSYGEDSTSSITLDFADEPGIEWVFEASDCSAQEGALRFLPRAEGP